MFAVVQTAPPAALAGGRMPRHSATAIGMRALLWFAVVALTPELATAPTAPTEDVVIWGTAEGDILTAPVMTGRTAEGVRRLSSPSRAVEVDESRCFIYYSSPIDRAVMRTQMDGFGVPEVFADLRSLPRTDYAVDIWLDKESSMLYILTYFSRLVRVTVDPGSIHYKNKTEEHVTTLSGFTGAVSFAIDTRISHDTPRIYVSDASGFRIIFDDWGSDTIVSAFIDSWAPGGSSLLVGAPGDIALDFANNRLVYADSGGEEIPSCIRRASLANSSIMDFVAWGEIGNLDIHAVSGSLIWSDTRTKQIKKANLNGTLDSSSRWPIAVPDGQIPNAGIAISSVSRMSTICFTTTTTRTTKTATTTTNTTSTVTTQTRTSTTGTLTSTTATNTTTQTRTTTTKTTTSTSKTTSTSTTLTFTSTTLTSSTSSTITRTSTTFTDTSTTTTFTTSTSSTLTTSTSSTTFSTSSSSTSRSSTTSSTQTTTTITTTSSTATSTLHRMSIFAGTISCVVSHVERAVAEYNAMDVAFRKAFAVAVGGIEAYHFTRVSFKTSGQPQPSGEGLLDISWEVRMPEKEAKQQSLNKQNFADADFVSAESPVFTSVGIALYSCRAVFPTYVVVDSMSTTTLTATVTTTTSTGWQDFRVVMSGTLSFADVGISLEPAEALTVAEGAIATCLDVSLEEVNVQFSEVGRRLATVWTILYTVTVVPDVAVGLSTRTVGDGSSSLRSALIDGLVSLGQPRRDLEASFELKGFTAPVMSTSVGDTPAGVCGPDICKPDMAVKVGVQQNVCFEALPCEYGRPLCCEAPVPSGMPLEDKSLIKTASSVWVAIALGILALIAASVTLCWAIRASHARGKSFSKALASFWQIFEPTEKASCGIVLDLPSTFSPDVKEHDIDKAILQHLIESLQGQWQIGDGSAETEPARAPSSMSGRLVDLGEHGCVTCNGKLVEGFALRIDTEGILRGDGWFMDMQRSDADHLEWWRDASSAVVTWQRVNGLTSFSIDETVEWLPATGEVAAGTRGQVVGFTDTRLKVSFGSKVVLALPVQLAHIGPSADGSSAGVPRSVRGLPSLSLCADLLRLGHHVQAMALDHDKLSGERLELRSQLTGMSASLAQENFMLREVLVAEEDARKELTNRLASETQGMCEDLDLNIVSEEDSVDIAEQRQRAFDLARLNDLVTKPLESRKRPTPLEISSEASSAPGLRMATPPLADIDRGYMNI